MNEDLQHASFWAISTFDCNGLLMKAQSKQKLQVNRCKQ